MRSVGLDLSARCTGMALVGDGEDRGKTIELPKWRGFSRLQLIAANVSAVLLAWHPEVIVIEDYAFYRNIDSFITLVEVGTMVKSHLYEAGIPWFDVRVATLKMWTTGKGNAKKPDMAAACKARWGFDNPSDDINDAYALAQMGQMSIEELTAIKGVTRGA